MFFALLFWRHHHRCCSGSGLVGQNFLTFSDLTGAFKLEFPTPGEYDLKISAAGYLSKTQHISIDAANETNLGIIFLRVDENAMIVTGEDFIPVISIESEDGNAQGGQEDISGLLTAATDPFVSAASFTFGTRRFRIKGYDSENTLTYLNGAPVNDLENGRVVWGNWGGLNDVLRNREISADLSATDFSFGGLGGATHIDTRARNIRKQKSISQAVSNTSYRFRTMATYATGMMDNGWALAASASRRWAQEGYEEGTTYDAYSYFLSVDKELTEQQMLNLTILGAPAKRGRSSSSFQEMYDIAGTNFYNPNWGYQNGEKRNANVANSHQPIISLRHDWTNDTDMSITTGANYQFGRNGTTALDWYNARDPRPDYYRYLPSYLEDERQAEELRELMSSDERYRQIDWDYMYEANRNSVYTGDQVPELAGQLRAQYLVEERRFDSREANFNSTIRKDFNDYFTLNGGIEYQYQKQHVYKEVVDLLGADFTLNIDRFAERDLPEDDMASYNDLNNPDLVVREGDIYGYDYDSNIRKGNVWAQGQFVTRRVDGFIGVNVNNTSMWREGHMKNGRFPDDSFGESEKLDYLNYGLKGGLMYKLDGRNYFHLRGHYQTRAPFSRVAFVSPRTRNEVTPGLTEELMYGGEAGFSHRAPAFKAQANIYYTQFKDQTSIRGVYFDLERTFGNLITTGIDKRHAGVELAAEVKLNTEWKLTGVAAIGQHIFNDRPKAVLAQDNNGELLVNNETIYLKNFYVAGTPQSAYTLGLSYWGKNFFSLWFNLSYLDNMWIDVNPLRRTTLATAPVEQGSDLWYSIIDQEKGDGALMADISARKSWRIGDYYLIANIGINNLFDHQDFKTGGFEQFRFDYEEKNVDRFPPEYYYGFGLTYFANVTFRF
jgi:hypothetical protein